MKKTNITAVIVAIILISLFMSLPSTTGFAGHAFSEAYFAIEVDLAVGDPSTPDVISDLLDAGAMTGDSNQNVDLQFYIAYMNNSGIEVAYSAFEKLEYDLKFRDFLNPTVTSVLESGAFPDYEPTLDEKIFHINATAPFQQLVQHFTTPWDEDVFVTNNFMSLIAYSSSPDDQLMDSEDELYLGYTFSVQNLIDTVNDVITANGHSKKIDHFNVKPYFERLSNDSFKFGINYTNMFVLWQDINVAPRGVDIIGGAVADTSGIVFGRDIVAASMLDYLAFEYEYTTHQMSGVNNYTLGTVTSHYNIGETNLLLMKDSVIPTASWNNNPFLSDVHYTLDIPDAVADATIPGVGTIPTEVIINMPSLAFYTGDDAKARIKMDDGFGITVATATTTFGVSVSDPTYNNDLNTSKRLELSMGGNNYFFTDFTGKDTYNLKGLDDLWGIDPNADRPVYIIPFNPSPSWGITGVAKDYFTVEFELAYGFTRFMATQLTPQLFSMPTSHLYVESVLYFTFTEFPEWYGGEIIHDPVYVSVAKPYSEQQNDTTTTTTTTTPTTTTTTTTPTTTTTTTTPTTTSTTTTTTTPELTPGFSTYIALVMVVSVIVMSKRQKKS